ncbi:MAG: sodium:solute symporter family transporter [Arenicella sp.]
MTLMTVSLMIISVAVLLSSVLITPVVRTTDGFFKGFSDSGEAPKLLTLVLSQVTTWIFARSLMTAAILGYYYGIAGALAYAAYYFSFITGGLIIDHLRFKHGYESVQSYLLARFGSTGSTLYNIVIILRLLSEVFANLIVVGEIFALKGSMDYFLAMLVIGMITLAYSSVGGLRASLRTDVLQAVLVLGLLVVLFFAMLGHTDFDAAAIFNSTADIKSPGWVLLLVAALQVWSYPLHDPVMMDRGFIADRQTTRKSFYHAAWISICAILMFALLGVFAGLNQAEGENLISTMTRLFGIPLMVAFNAALIISALSTLDSTFSSASKLVIKDMGLLKPTLNNGRLVMLVFLIVGGLFLLWDSKDLYAAVAVSGTLSMFLLPVIVFCIWGNKDVHLWPLVLTFAVAVLGGVMYVIESAGYVQWMEPWFGFSHKYSKLLIICLIIMAVGCISFLMGQKQSDER